MTKDNWIKAFDEKFPYNGCIFEDDGRSYNFEDIKNFISQVEKDAKERGYQLGLRDGIKKEHENSGAWTDLNKQGVINTHKLVKDAIEKTNKRWREKYLGWEKEVLKLATDKQYLKALADVKSYGLPNLFMGDKK